MKTVKITIEGTLKIVCYCTEKEDFWDNYYMAFGFGKIDSISATIDGKRKDIQNEIGEDTIVRNLLRSQFNSREQGLPVEVGEDEDPSAIVNYEIQLKDNEEFDPSKLHLQKSVKEFPQYPVWIEATSILYKRKKINTTSHLGDYEGVEPEFEVS